MSQARNKPKAKYDEISDTLIITFESGAKATGISLTDHILLRYDFENHKPVGLHLTDYSILIQPTEIGVQNFPMTHLAKLSEAEQDEIFRVLLAEPVNQFLSLSAYTVSITERMPIIALKKLPNAVVA
ncbi:MAG: DUF2283 domain-containing protein [Leptolyngbya sp. SIO4C1]|nr:DUF2283 domain-containing protein [Leptolyngbya sp. SIO4C1]